MPESRRERCPDRGTCHHGCADDELCFRVEAASPFSNVFPDDRWPDSAHKPDAKLYKLDDPIPEPPKKGRRARVHVDLPVESPAMVVWEWPDGFITYIHADPPGTIGPERLERIKARVKAMARENEHGGRPEHVRVPAGAFEEAL